MAGSKNITSFFRRLTERFGRSALRPSDSGLFDPYVPVGSLKRIEKEYQADYELTEQKDVLAEDDQPKNNFSLVRLLSYLVVLLLGARLITLQITRGQEYYLLAEGNRTKSQTIAPPRGLIYDRNGSPLVRNTPSFSAVFRLADYPRSKTDQDKLFSQLATVLGDTPENLRNSITSSLKLKQDTTVLKEGIDRDQALSYEIKLNGVTGTEIIKTPIRNYDSLPSLGQILGYIGKVTSDDLKNRPELLSTSFLGKAGLEKSYDEQLQGQPGAETLEVDSKGHTIRSVGSRPPVTGQSLVLGLDSKIQETAANALKDSIEKNHATSGAAVAMDVRTGDVLAMVSFPNFDNNLFAQTTDSAKRQAILADPASPLVNRAIAGQYPSGSTIKPVIATAGLSEKVITPSTRLDTSDGKITVGQWTFSDWKTHGIADVKQAIAESNNIFFFAVGGGYKQIGGLGANRLDDWLHRFGFGSATGLDIPGEANGLVPTPDWKKKVRKESWYIGDTYNLSIGQGDFLLTPLQLTRATAAIANGGTLLQPKLVKTILGGNGNEVDIKSRVVNDHVAATDVLDTVRAGMRLAVTAGSARSFNGLGVEVAAKTGTAQTSSLLEHTHSWFTCFAPYQNPQIAISVIVEGGGEGYAVAAPVAKNMIEQAFNLPLTPITPAPPTVN